MNECKRVGYSGWRRVAAIMAIFSATAFAQDYPRQSIKVVVPFAPSGATDLMARALTEKLKDRLRQPIVVENKPGGGTMIASEYVARAAPDGYTLLVAGSSLTNAPAIYSKVNYDPIRDFAPIMHVADVPHLVVVNADLPVRNVAELVTYIKNNPTKANYGTSGVGSSNHLETELFAMQAGVKLNHIPYKGAAPAALDLVGGQLQFMFDAIATMGPHIKSGKLRPIATVGQRRTAFFPELPTVAESGVSGYSYAIYLGMLAPAGTPRDVVNRVNRELVEVLKDGETKERFKTFGLDIVGDSPDEFSEFLKREVALAVRLVKATGATAD